jgi:hypothetical protein
MKNYSIKEKSKLNKFKTFLMKKYQTLFTRIVLIPFVLLTSHAAFADLPTPPSSDMADSSNDWVSVGINIFSKSLKFICLGLGVGILVSTAAGIVKSYHTAHEKQDLGHFFKMLVVGLIAASLGAGLVYVGYNIIPEQS